MTLIAPSLTEQAHGGPHQLRELERLREDAVRAAARLRRQAALAGDEHDRQVRLLALQLVEQLDPARAAHVDVEQDHADTAAADLAAGSVECRRLAYRESVELEVHPTEKPQRWVVVDDEDAPVVVGHSPQESTDATGRSRSRIPSLNSRVGSEERHGYANELDGLWADLRRTLHRLDEIASRPEDELLDGEAPDELARLRYKLHLAGERAYGIEAPRGDEPSLLELADALAEARDATADVADAVEEGGAEAVQELVPEWRGALFRVRLARLRLDGRRPPQLPRLDPEPRLAAPLAGLLLTVSGASLFVLGATLQAWPLWLGGLLAVLAGLLVYRP